MADQAQPQSSGSGQAKTSLVISAEIQEKFGALIELIKASESMNDEERQYWINILPVMTPEQLKNLEDILTSEKKQLQAIDAKYSKELSKAGSEAAVATMEQKIKSKKKEREQAEEQEATKEQSHEEEILAQIQSF